MKTSKKIIIPFFSTVVGLSLAAGIGGAFAWYQYNSQTTASFIGSSVADTGVLQIGWKETVNNQEVMRWGKDYVKTGNAAKLLPVTFGQLGANNALPEKAYTYPEAGCGTGYANRWVEATKGEQYSEMELYMRALVPDPAAPGDAENGIAEGYKLAERNVFLSDFVCETVTENKDIAGALRIHIAPEGQNARLLSRDAHNYNPSADPVVDNRLNLFGPLDLDQDGATDKAVKTAFKDLADYGTWDDDDDPSTPEVARYAEGDEIIYGNPGDKQETEALSAIQQARDADGKMPVSTDANFSKKILTTSTSGAVKVTVTIWLEGWEYLKKSATANSQEWNPKYTADAEVKVGLQFDSGIFRGEDL